MSIRSFLAGTLIEDDIKALGFKDSADCEMVVTLEQNRINPEGPYMFVPLDVLKEALSGEDTMFLTNVRNYHHHFQRAHGMTADKAPQEVRKSS